MCHVRISSKGLYSISLAWANSSELPVEFRNFPQQLSSREYYGNKFWYHIPLNWPRGRWKLYDLLGKHYCVHCVWWTRFRPLIHADFVAWCQVKHRWRNKLCRRLSAFRIWNVYMLCRVIQFIHVKCVYGKSAFRISLLISCKLYEISLFLLCKRNNKIIDTICIITKHI